MPMETEMLIFIILPLAILGLAGLFFRNSRSGSIALLFAAIGFAIEAGVIWLQYTQDWIYVIRYSSFFLIPSAFLAIRHFFRWISLRSQKDNSAQFAFLASAIGGLVYHLLSGAAFSLLRIFHLSIPQFVYGILIIGFLYFFLRAMRVRTYDRFWMGVVSALVSFLFFNLHYYLIDRFSPDFSMFSNIFISVQIVYDVIVPSVLSLAIIYILRTIPEEEVQ